MPTSCNPNPPEVALPQNNLGGLCAVHLSYSEVDVHEDKIDPGHFFNGLYSFFSGIRDDDFIPVVLKGYFFAHSDDRFIFHRKDCFLIFTAHG